MFGHDNSSFPFRLILSNNFEKNKRSSLPPTGGQQEPLGSQKVVQSQDPVLDAFLSEALQEFALVCTTPLSKVTVLGVKLACS